MKQGKSIFLVIYFIAVSINITANYLELSTLAHYSKVLLMPFLFGFILSKSWYDIRLRKFIGLAIIFSWLGDIFLIFTEEFPLTFVFGLSAFLIGHIFYIVSNLNAQIGKNSLGAVVPIIIILIVVFFGIYLINTLYPVLGEMKVPVILYAVVIVAMSISAAMRYGKTSRMSFWFVVIGALVFMLSDSMIAVDKFQSQIENARV